MQDIAFLEGIFFFESFHLCYIRLLLDNNKGVRLNCDQPLAGGKAECRQSVTVAPLSKLGMYCILGHRAKIILDVLRTRPVNVNEITQVSPSDRTPIREINNTV